MRQALVDSSLLARRAARRFIGLLAELHEVVLVSTDEVDEEMPRAIRNALRMRISNQSFSERTEEALDEYFQWRQAYQEDDLWLHRQTPDPPTDYRVFALARMWEQARTDPDDLHLAQGVIIHDLDALFTANLTMVEPSDWDRIMKSLAPERRPAMCRNDEIIDWIVNHEAACENAELMVRSMLSVLPEGYSAEPRLRGWLTSLKNTFPRMTDAANEYLRPTTGSSLRWLHSESLEAFKAPITRQTMNAPGN
ncbi:hypothetical protein [Candidatus Foliamicus sp.]